MYKLWLKFLGKNPNQPKNERLLTFKILFITFAIIILTVTLGSAYLKSGLFLALTTLGSIAFTSTWLKKETKEKVYRIAVNHAFIVDAGFTIAGIILAFSVSLIIGLSFFFLGLLLTSSLRIIKYRKEA